MDIQSDDEIRLNLNAFDVRSFSEVPSAEYRISDHIPPTETLSVGPISCTFDHRMSFQPLDCQSVSSQGIEPLFPDHYFHQQSSSPSVISSASIATNNIPFPAPMHMPSVLSHERHDALNVLGTPSPFVV